MVSVHQYETERPTGTTDFGEYRRYQFARRSGMELHITEAWRERGPHLGIDVYRMHKATVGCKDLQTSAVMRSHLHRHLRPQALKQGHQGELLGGRHLPLAGKLRQETVRKIQPEKLVWTATP